MREIKFRAWDKSRGKFSTSGNLMIDMNGWKWWQFGMTAEPLGEKDGGNFILMQYTGLKDKNGKEIYEGDVVRLGDEDICNVYYSNDDESTYAGAWCVYMFGHEENMVSDYLDNCEVIGNIHEKLELLK